jgi:hypothetical protein
MAEIVDEDDASRLVTSDDFVQKSRKWRGGGASVARSREAA